MEPVAASVTADTPDPNPLDNQGLYPHLYFPVHPMPCLDF
ncbi:hypothetical protein DFR74_101128 [Nocardia puris]|uniref:Uncharacterized protein n=1 Tax=Nocardia puris TaxID=208602 RepID=A0A366E1D9_9NOCA|nr:hypothetical protein DFR74_101128 [Nocardia puris]